MTENLNINEQLTDDHIDDQVDEEIELCLSSENPKNFFLFAGAGSGKTRSLVKALMFLDKKMGTELSANAKLIAVITYTNAASEEISKRLQYKPNIHVSTIHSFLWDLIKDYQTDIKQWIIHSLKDDISILQEKENKRSSDKRVDDIRRKTERLNRISTVKFFNYNPNGENFEFDSLNHSEVIAIGSEFIASEPTMQDILTSRFPFILIDESQDTKKELVDSLLIVCEKYEKNFIIGMFGDTMQKIYMDGKENLADCIPDKWERPRKVMNHRSAKRIVTLANAIRGTVDGQSQRARSDAEEGFVRLFIIEASDNKERTERQIAQIMSEISMDEKWNDETEYKTLILEHHMAASRFNFLGLFTPLNESGEFATSLRNGSIEELSFLAKIVSPLVKAYKAGNDFEVAKIVRKYSPLLNRSAFLVSREDEILLLKRAEKAVDSLLELWKDGKVPSCIDILKSINETRLFEQSNSTNEILHGFSEGENSKLTALRSALSVQFDELERYSAYVNENTRFATHQGIKGLEFPRVMVIMDDAEARGFQFSYEKLFGAKAKTITDIENEEKGKDTSITRTTRLFYVACTRAEKSLAVVAYTVNSESVKQTALSNNWFMENEIQIVKT